MPNTSPATDAGAGAEALLGLAAGRQVRLPSLTVIPDASKPAPSPLRSTSQHSFLPTPPTLQLPQQTPAPIRHLPPPSNPLLPPATERLPTISEWAEPNFRPLPPPPLHPPPTSDRLADRWQQSSSLPTPYAYAHTQNHWPSHPRSHTYQHPPPPNYYYYNTPPQPHTLPTPYSIPPHAPLHTSVTPVPPPLALPVRRSDPPAHLRPVAPIVEHIPALDHLCEAARADTVNCQSASLVPIDPTPAHSHPITHATQPSVIPSLIQSCQDEATLSRRAMEAKPHTPSRARGLADLINPTNSPPPTSRVMHEPVKDVVKPTHHAPKVDMGINSQMALPRIQTSYPRLPQVAPDVVEPARKQSRSATPRTPRPRTPRPRTPTSRTSTPRTPTPRASSSHKGQRHAAQPATPVVSALSNAGKSSNASRGTKAERKAQASSSAGDTRASRKYERPPRTSAKREEEDDDDEESNDSEVTRCPCLSLDNTGFMIACDECNSWQHGRCMGYRRRADLPDKYFCNLCRPEEMRINCIAHPRYKDRHSKDREARETRRDIEALLAHVKPLELRRMFATDYKHRKSLLKGGKDQVVMKYAHIMKGQFTKHRQGVVDGLSVLLDLPRGEIADKLDSALRKIRHSGSERGEDGGEKKRTGASSSLDGASADGVLRSGSQARSGTKRQRPPSLVVENLDGGGPSRGDAAMQVEAPGDIEMNDLGNSRGMSREERKLREAMKLFARMEEREERKRPRLGDTGYSPRSGHNSRPKTPRSTSNTRVTSPRPSTPRAPAPAPVDVGARKSDAVGERTLFGSEEDRPSRGDASESQTLKVSLKVENPDAPQNHVKKESVKVSHKVVSPTKAKAEAEASREISKRERQRSDRHAARRKDAKETVDNSAVPNQRRERSMFDRNRSHDAKRRRPLGRDGRNVKEPVKRDPALDVVVVVPGPSVLGSRRIPKSRLSKLERNAVEAEEAAGRRTQAQQSFPLVKKDAAVRIAEQERKEMMEEASPMKKRYRLPLAEVGECSNSKNVHTDGKGKEAAKPSTLSVSMVVVSEKGNLPDNGEKLESSRLVAGTGAEVEKLKGDRKKFCLKKRSIMLEVKKEAPKKAEQQGDGKLVGKISPVSPNSASQSTSPTHTRNVGTVGTVATPSKAVSSPKPMSPIATCSPKLRSSPVSALRSTVLRSAPAPVIKRVRSPKKGEGVLSSALAGKKSGDSRRASADGKDALSTPAAGGKSLRNECARPDNSVSGSVIAGAVSVGGGAAVVKGEGKAVEKIALRSKPSTPHATTPRANGGVAVKVGVKGTASVDTPKRTFQIPLSKPVPLPHGQSSEATTPVAVGVRRNLSLGGLGLRSVPAEVARGSSVGNGKSLMDTAKLPLRAKDVGVNAGLKEDGNLESGDTISDLLHKRLEGFLIPAVNAAKANANAGTSGGLGGDVRKRTEMKGPGLGVRGGVEKSRHHGAVGGGKGPLRSVAAAGSGPSGYRGKPMDGKSGPWGAVPSYSNSKRPHGAYHSGRSPMAPGGNNHNHHGHGHSHHHSRKDGEKKNGSMGGSKSWGGHHHSYRGGYNNMGGGSRGGGNGGGGNAAGSSNDSIGRGGGRRRRHD